ncbi:hypothetical protein PENTCL1PPCAC_25802, partial [Pristionchus entomophagus]
MARRNPDVGLDNLASEFDYESEAERKRAKKRGGGDLTQKEYPAFRRSRNEQTQNTGSRMSMEDFIGTWGKLMHLNAYQRHKGAVPQEITRTVDDEIDE